MFGECFRLVLTDRLRWKPMSNEVMRREFCRVDQCLVDMTRPSEMETELRADRAAAREIFDDIASRISEPELRATFEATFAEIEEGVG